MKNSAPKYLSFVKKDRRKFLVKIKNLSTRAKYILEDNDIQSWDSFYYHIFVNHDIKNFRVFRNSGIKTEKELINLMRNMLNPDGRYSKELEKFEYDFNQLSSRARIILKSIGISLFETFYYRYVVEKEIIDFSSGRYSSSITRPEIEQFVASFCSYLGVKVPTKKPIIYFDPNNPKIPFTPDKAIKKKFSSEFNKLSKTTRSQLIKMKANSIQEFYLAFLSPDSQFNLIFKEIRESNLLEILRLRTILKDTINQIKKNDSKLGK